MAAVAAERLSRGGHEGEQLVSDHSCRRGGVCGECAMPEHLRLEHGPAIADLAPARLAPAWRMERIVTVQPGLLRRPVDMEQEYAVEQIQHVVLVAGDAADEHRPVLPGQDLLHPAAAPHPAMRPSGAGGPGPRVGEGFGPAGCGPGLELPPGRAGKRVRLSLILLALWPRALPPGRV